MPLTNEGGEGFPAVAQVTPEKFPHLFSKKTKSYLIAVIYLLSELISCMSSVKKLW